MRNKQGSGSRMFGQTHVPNTKVSLHSDPLSAL